MAVPAKKETYYAVCTFTKVAGSDWDWLASIVVKKGSGAYEVKLSWKETTKYTDTNTKLDGNEEKMLEILRNQDEYYWFEFGTEVSGPSTYNYYQYFYYPGGSTDQVDDGTSTTTGSVNSVYDENANYVGSWQYTGKTEITASDFALTIEDSRTGRFDFRIYMGGPNCHIKAALGNCGIDGQLMLELVNFSIRERSGSREMTTNQYFNLTAVKPIGNNWASKWKLNYNLEYNDQPITNTIEVETSQVALFAPPDLYSPLIELYFSRQYINVTITASPNNGADVIGLRDTTESSSAWETSLQIPITATSVADCVRELAVKAKPAQGYELGPVTIENEIGWVIPIQPLPDVALYDDEIGTFKTECDNATSGEQHVFFFDITVTVNFYEKAITKYQIKTEVSPSAPPGGIASGGGIFDEGATCTLSAYPNEGYRFHHWEDKASPGNPVSTDNPYSFTVTRDATYVAVFIRQYRIDVVASPIIWGSVAMSPQCFPSGSEPHMFDEGATVVLTATPFPGCVFLRWESAEDSRFNNDTNQVITVTVTKDATYTAIFDEAGGHESDDSGDSDDSSDEGMMVYSAPMDGSQGDTDPSEVPFSIGDMVTFTATAKPGFRFSHWSKGDDPAKVSKSKVLKIYPTAEDNGVTYYANFKPKGPGLLLWAETDGNLIYDDRIVECHLDDDEEQGGD